MNPPAKTFKSSLRILSRQLHKWLALIVGIQVLAWVLGGALFALMPFAAWVKSGDVLHKPVKPAEQPALRAGALPLAEVAARHAPLLSLELIGQGRAIYYRATRPDGTKFLVDPRSGDVVGPLDEALVRRLATELYAGTASVTVVQRIDRAETRWGIVDEIHGKLPAWRVMYDDRFSTRLYFAADSGEFLRARNDTWVVFDFFWRLHIMDYGSGEDFNNGLMRIAAVLALVLVATGLVMLCFTRFRLRVGR